MNRRWIRLPLTLMVLASLVMGSVPQAIVAQQETLAHFVPEDWEQLTNNLYGYTLQYPSGSIAKLYEPEGVLQIFVDPDTYPFVISVYDNPNEITAEAWGNGWVAGDQKMNDVPLEKQVLTAREIAVGDYIGYMVAIDAIDHESDNIFLTNNHRIYEFSFPSSNPEDPESDQHHKLFLQMLATFQFGDFAANTGFQVIKPQIGDPIQDLPVPIFNQLDSRWKCHQLGTCVCGNGGICKEQPTWNTIGSSGCAISSAAMVMNYYVPGFTDPDRLNTCLTNNEGYAFEPPCKGNCLIKWENCLPNGVSYNQKDASKLDEDLRAGKPVIAALNGHFVVVIGKRADGSYNINDPNGGVTRDLSAGKILGVRRYNGQPPVLPNQPPNPPDLMTPSNGYTSHDGLGPTLCWRDNGDPNGDGVSFHAEVRGGVNADSDWTSNTCWRPGNLDGQYGSYQWRVEVRDSRGATQWSNQTWQFSIEQPNQLPSIAFNTANGSSATLIESRERAWTFLGTASDPDGQVTRVEFRCSGDNCGSGATQATGTTSWSLARSAMAGKNDVHFVAYDNQGASVNSRHLDLRIDLAAPTTNYNLVGAPGENGWYISPVEVRLQAADGATGNARVGVARIHYRVDGGDWQHPSGSDTRVTVSGDGAHTVDYYAEDGAGNIEGQKQLTFKIDATLPTVPNAIAESHSVVSGQWQKDWNDPAFTWSDANDATSGVWYYRVSWGGTLHFPTSPAFDPLAVRTGSYALRIRAVDRAGNLGPESAPFTFRYDGSRPHTPDIQNLDGVASGVWQNHTRAPNFSWPTPIDEGSGVVGYNVYWGPDEQGSSTVLSTTNTFSRVTPICAADSAATYYLRARSQDGVGLQSDWVGYALAYDGAPPNLTLTVNYGQPVVHQRNVYVNVAALDLGSGVAKMRLSTEGYTWTDWQDYLAEFYWEIPAVGRRTYDIYAQVHDGVGNMSPIVSATVYFDVNTPLPGSETFQLWDSVVPAGAGIITGSNPSTYTMRVTIGQPAESPLLTNPHYQLRGGFQAGALAVPTVTPTYTTYVQIGSLLASATTTATAMASTHHRLYGSLGQPSDMQTVTSTNYVADLGFWAGAARDVIPQPPEPPEPPLPPECEFYSLSINNGALFTRVPQVTLNMCGPDPTQMMLSNDGGFSSATWQAYTRTISWTLTTYGDTIIPRFVYARYKDPQDVIHGTFFDDIIYDPTAPAGAAAFDPAALLSDGVVRQAAQARAPRPLRVVQEREAELFLSVSDDSSGLAEMQVSFTPEFSETTWQPYSAITPVAFADDGLHTIYIRTRDQAGNVSEPISDSLMVDTTPPVLHPDGILAFAPDIVGPETLSATLIIYGYDNLTSLSEMRISQRADFTDTLWVPYILESTVPISFTGEVQPVWYVQVRDEAGNASETYTATYTVDVTPPVVYVEVSPGATLTRTLTILVYDDLSRMGDMRLSNDPLMLDGVVTLPYSTTVTWGFDERHVVWVQVADSVGNFSEPFPAYAAEMMPNQAPYTPTNPIPANGATSVPTNTLLTWEGGDPDGDIVTYTVTLSRTGWSTVFLPPVVTNSTVASYNPGPLEFDVTYYWNISASDRMSTTTGPVWSFNTGTSTEYKVYLPLVLRQ